MYVCVYIVSVNVVSFMELIPWYVCMWEERGACVSGSVIVMALMPCSLSVFMSACACYCYANDTLVCVYVRVCCYYGTRTLL